MAECRGETPVVAEPAAASIDTQGPRAAAIHFQWTENGSPERGLDVQGVAAEVSWGAGRSTT